MGSLTFRLVLLVGILFSLIIVGALGFMAFEGLPFGDALYFTIVTVSTVGYGDIHASTLAGRILAIALIIIGVGIFLGVIANGTEVLLQRRDDKVRKERLHTLVGVFFSEIGIQLLKHFADADPDVEQIRQQLLVEEDWSDEDFDRLQELLGKHDYSMDMEKANLKSLRDFLREKGDLLIRLLENPDLREHESFTELLRAIFHLKDELTLRPKEFELPDTDVAHLSNDVKRAYITLAKQWISYMYNLKQSYPYLFSLALRTNPFFEKLTTVVH